MRKLSVQSPVPLAPGWRWCVACERALPIALFRMKVTPSRRGERLRERITVGTCTACKQYARRGHTVRSRGKEPSAKLLAMSRPEWDLLQAYADAHRWAAEGEFWCRPCVTFKPLSESIRKGPNRFCRPCKAKADREWRRNRARREGREYGTYVSPAERRVSADTRAVEHVARRAAMAIARTVRALVPQAVRREREAEHSRRMYWRHPERQRDRTRAYKYEHPILVQSWEERRTRRMMAKSDGTVTREAVYAALTSRSSCPYCAATLTRQNRTLEHLEPVSRSGLHTRANLSVCCRACNQRKGGKRFADWLRLLKPGCRRAALALYRRQLGTEPEQDALPLTFGGAA